MKKSGKYIRIIPSDPFGVGHTEEQMALERQYYYLELTGDSFSPSETEKRTGLVLHNKLEPGEPCYFRSKKHPLYGEPSLFGWAMLQPPDNIGIYMQHDWVLKILEEYVQDFRNFGADKIVYWQVCWFLPNAQKNFELSVSDLRVLSSVDVPFCLSVYDLEPDDSQPMSDRLYSQLYKNHGNPNGA